MARVSTKERAMANSGPVPLRFTGDDGELVIRLKAGHPGAMEALYDRYAAHVQRMLVRVMGLDRDLGDLVQDVFVEAFTHVSAIKDGRALKAWLTTLAIFTARQHLRKRRRRRAHWVRDAADYLDIPVSDMDPSAIEVLRLTYRVLETMPADDRIVFSLRFIEGMEITEAAAACRVSVSTLKRRLKRAEKRFSAIAHRFAVLKELIDESERWRGK